MLRAYSFKRFGNVGYWDAGLATPLDEATAMHRLAVSRPGVLMLLGLRLNRLGASVYDTQYGAFPFR